MDVGDLMQRGDGYGVAIIATVGVATVGVGVAIVTVGVATVVGVGASIIVVVVGIVVMTGYFVIIIASRQRRSLYSGYGREGRSFRGGYLHVAAASFANAGARGFLRR